MDSGFPKIMPKQNALKHMAWPDGAAKAAQSRPGAAKYRLGNPLRRWLVCTFDRLKALARPGDMNHSAVIGKDPVGEGDFCAGALQQRAGDEDAEAKPAALAFVIARP